MSADLFKDIVSHSKEYGFIFPSSEVYDGLSGVYDYGPYGVELKNNIKTYWWKSMVQYHENIVGLDAAIMMHPKTWKASGHVDAFNDPLVDSKASQKRYRADVLIEEALEKIQAKADKEIEKARKRFGDAFDENKYKTENPRVAEYLGQLDKFHVRFVDAMGKGDMPELKALIEELEIADPVSGSREWTHVRQFNLMFHTQLGNIAGEEGKLYLRPETAQGIFVNFLNVQKTTRQKLPFGIAQIGKAFRNEIIARQFIFRMREFEQMEMQFFIRPGTEDQWYEYWKEERMKWHLSLGFSKEKYRFKDHPKLAFYAKAACDIEYEFPIGFKEVEGIHSRTDFDLKNHEKFSGKKLQYFDPEDNQNFIPYVVETSVGLDRLFLSVLSKAYTEEKLEDGSERVVLKIPAPLAPNKVAILPLMKKDGLPEKAMEIMNVLKFDLKCFYEEKDAIGKRYRRQDAIGTPYCITIDHDTLQDDAVTIRDRDTMKQERVPISELDRIVSEKVDMKGLLKRFTTTMVAEKFGA